jgi:hypothetical protein
MPSESIKAAASVNVALTLPAATKLPSNEPANCKWCASKAQLKEEALKLTPGTPLQSQAAGACMAAPPPMR